MSWFLIIWENLPRGSRPACLLYCFLGLAFLIFQVPNPWTQFGEWALAAKFFYCVSVPIGIFVLAHWSQLPIRRRAAGLCPACGYDLRASKGRCPECGRQKIE
jgi:hypothetical protein